MFRILVADDEGIMLESIKSIILSNFGSECQVACVKTGRAVIEQAEAFRPDIAIVDIQMPGLSGIQAIREVRRFNSSMVFIIITAYDKFSYAQEAVNLGVMEFITKPVNKKKILDVCIRAMHQVEEARKKLSDDLKIREKLELVVPMIESGFIYNLLHSDWVGWSNFTYFFKSNAFWMLLRNTIVYNLVFIALGAAVAVGFALMLSNLRNKLASKAYQTMMFFPYFMSWVVISYIVYAVLTPEKGYLNNIIVALGGTKIMWYQEPKYWPFILTFLRIWKGMGYGMVIYLATITGIDPSLYEAAVMDGATKWQQTKHITMPCIKPVLIMMLILDAGKIFYSDFGLFYQATGGIPASLYNVASTFDTYIYKAIQSSAPIGKTAAASFFQSVCCCATILLTNWLVKKVDEDSAII